MGLFTGQTVVEGDFFRASLGAQKSNSGSFPEETILQGTLPANILMSGRHIRIRCIFSVLNRAVSGSNGSCTFNLYFGATLIATLTSPNGFNPTHPGLLEGIIRYNGINAEHATLYLQNGSPLPQFLVATGSATESLSSSKTIALKVVGNDGAYTTNACTIEVV